MTDETRKVRVVPRHMWRRVALFAFIMGAGIIATILDWPT